MRILYDISYTNGLGADRWIFDAWKDGFEALGHECIAAGGLKKIQELCHTTKVDIVMVAVDSLRLLTDAEVLHDIRKHGAKVALQVHWPLDDIIDYANAPAVLVKDDLADLYYGEREPESMVSFEAETGKKYHLIPNAACPKHHYQTPVNPRFQYDIAYVGASMPKKRWFAKHVLKPLSKKYKVGLFGAGWTLRDQSVRALSKYSRKLGLVSLSRRLDSYRLVLSPTQENELYSSAKICLNFHERDPDGSQPHYILNQRTFKIPACGGFEICDQVPALEKYFSKDEIVTAGMDANEWQTKIDYYLKNEAERERIRKNGISRAHKDHMSTNRVQLLLKLIKGA